HDPHHATVNHRGVRGAVQLKVGSNARDAVERVAIVEDLRLTSHTVREQYLLLAKFDGIHELGEWGADARAALALIRRVDLARGRFVVGVVELPWARVVGRTHDRIVGDSIAKVDARL